MECFCLQPITHVRRITILYPSIDRSVRYSSVTTAYNRACNHSAKSPSFRDRKLDASLVVTAVRLVHHRDSWVFCIIPNPTGRLPPDNTKLLVMTKWRNHKYRVLQWMTRKTNDKFDDLWISVSNQCRWLSRPGRKKRSTIITGYRIGKKLGHDSWCTCSQLWRRQMGLNSTAKSRRRRRCERVTRREYITP